MAVAYDSAGPSTVPAGRTADGMFTLTWTHTTVAASTYLLAALEVDNVASTNGTANLSTATCNGTGMTSLGAYDCNASGGAGYLQVFGFALSGAGAQTIIASYPTTYADVAGASIAVTGETGLGTVYRAQGTSITPSVSVAASTSGNLCVGFTAVGDTIVSATSPSTSRVINNWRAGGGSAAGNVAGATSPSTGSAVTMAWAATSAADPWAVIAVEVQGGPVVGTPGPVLASSPVNIPVIVPGRIGRQGAGHSR